MSLNEDGQSANAPYTSAERVKQLNDIDKDIAALLSSAGLAVKALTSSPSSSSDSPEEPITLESHKAAFTAATAKYFSLLSSVSVRLRRQIYALEEANIISAETPGKDSQTSTLPAAFSSIGSSAGASSAQAAAEKSTITAGGLGSLDVGWLNSRKDVVGKDMEAELWGKAVGLLEKLESASPASGDKDSMEVDTTD